MAALGGTQVLDDDTLYVVDSADWTVGAPPVVAWTEDYGTTWDEDNLGSGVPDVDNPYQKWPRWY